MRFKPVEDTPDEVEIHGQIVTSDGQEFEEYDLVQKIEHVMVTARLWAKGLLDDYVAMENVIVDVLPQTEVDDFYKRREQDA